MRSVPFFLFGFTLLAIFVTKTAIAIPSQAVVCGQEEYVCRGGRTCISGKFVCDGVIDCPQGDDEEKCHQQTVSTKSIRSCPLGHYDCTRSDICVPLSSVCDGRIDCPFGDDELSSSCGQKLNQQSNRSPLKEQLKSRHRRDTSRQLLKEVVDVDVQDVEAVKEQASLDQGKQETVGTDFMAIQSKFNQQPNSTKDGNATEGINVKATKLIPSRDFKPITYSHEGSGYFFINFGNIIHGNENVNGPGNDLGNGNGNGNGNGAGNAGGKVSGGSASQNGIKGKNGGYFESEE